MSRVTLSEIYSKIPPIHCKGKCQEACGPIAMSKTEEKAIQGIAQSPLETAPFSPGNVTVSNFDKSTLRCPMLVHGRCSVYVARPLICRLWGVVKKMRCPFGCRPKRWLSQAEAYALMEAATEATS